MTHAFYCPDTSQGQRARQREAKACALVERARWSTGGRHARVRVGLSRRYRLAGDEVEKKPAVLSQANLHDCAGEKKSMHIYIAPI